MVRRHVDIIPAGTPPDLVVRVDVVGVTVGRVDIELFDWVVGAPRR